VIDIRTLTDGEYIWTNETWRPRQITTV